MSYRKKINIESITWNHHRSGWAFVMSHLMHLHVNKGVKFIGYGDGFFSQGKSLPVPWCAFLHNVPSHFNLQGKYRRSLSLSDILKLENWKLSLSYCQGIFTLCKYTERYLRNQGLKACSLIHPTEIPDIKFQKFQGKILHVGHWMRDYNAFFNLDCKNKYMLRTGHSSQKEDESSIKFNDSVVMLDRVSHEEYDNMLADSIVFLRLYDSAAVNTVIECMARNTPILVNKTPGVLEYLGKNYPFYYRDLEEAKDKANNLNLIKNTHEYLRNMDKTSLKPQVFLEKFVNSPIYLDLKVKHSLV